MISEEKKYLVLNNGQHLPHKGFGTFWVTENTKEVIKNAISVVYRHIDTASFYKNEQEIGQALTEIFSEGKIKREDLFVTTKIWNDEKENVEKSLRASLSKLQLDYVDLYLIHWPIGYYDNNDNLVQRPLSETWRDMEECMKKGLCKSIGVSS